MLPRLTFSALILLTACSDGLPREPGLLAPESSALVSASTDGHQGPSSADASYPDVIPLPTGFQPEGIAAGKGSTVFVGGFISGAVYRADVRTGEGEILVPPAPGERMAVGLAFDARSNLVFAAGGLTGAAFVYDAGTGEMVGAYPMGPPETTLLNDVVVTRQAAYFTDSFNPVLYRVPLGAAGKLPDPSEVQALPLTGDFQNTLDCDFLAPVNANGIDATPNGKHLILVNLCLGTLYRVDAETGEARLIDLGGDALPFGDGILLDGFNLYVVQNVLNQIAVVRLNRTLDAGVVTGIITDPLFRVPATIAEVGDALYAVNARFDVAPPPGVWPDVEFEVVRVKK